MSVLAIVMLAVVGIFVVLLFVKSVLSVRRLCVVCAAVFITWSVALILRWLNLFDSQLLLGILMGQSSLGVYYFVERRVQDDLLVFRLPFLVTMIGAVYTVITKNVLGDAILIVLILWTITGILYVQRSKPALKQKVQALIECCSKW